MELKFILTQAKGDDEEVVLPDSVGEIADAAFKGCHRLKRVAIPDHCAKIGADAFRNCKSLEEVYLPDSVRSIGENCFRGCTELRRVRISDNLRVLPAGAFAGCTALEELEDGHKVEDIGAEAFANCTALGSFAGRPLRHVGSRAFNNCTALRRVEFGPVLTSVEELAFRKCESLQSVQFGETVESLADRAFVECPQSAIHNARIVRQHPNAFERATAEACGALRPADEAALAAEFTERHEPDRLELVSRRTELERQRDALARELPQYGVLDLKKRDALVQRIDDAEAEMDEIALLLEEIEHPSWQSIVDDFESRLFSGTARRAG